MMHEHNNSSYNQIFTLIEALQSQLEKKADSKTKAWWERYLKHVIPFRGVKMADIRSVLHSWFRTEDLEDKLSYIEQMDLALELLRKRYSEDKIAGILLLQEILLPTGRIQWRRDLPRFAKLFADGYIFEWNTCDWFCVKVLGPLIRQRGKEVAVAISEWSNVSNLWQRRASVVAFVNLAKEGDDNFPGFITMLLNTCSVTIRSQERFVQTGTGWVLRELGNAEQSRVIEFIENHIVKFSKEGLRYAIKKMPDKVKERLIKLHGYKAD